MNELTQKHVQIKAKLLKKRNNWTSIIIYTNVEVLLFYFVLFFFTFWGLFTEVAHSRTTGSLITYIKFDKEHRQNTKYVSSPGCMTYAQSVDTSVPSGCGKRMWSDNCMTSN